MLCTRTFPGWSFSLLGRKIIEIDDAEANWRLRMWDGKKVIEIAQGDEIQAQWANGKDVFCWDG